MTQADVWCHDRPADPSYRPVHARRTGPFRGPGAHPGASTTSTARGHRRDRAYSVSTGRVHRRRPTRVLRRDDRS
ncbi:hypothetical protein AB852_17010 [Streptomyces uncialis]|uniref:Uncharacterized protein n=1 Tax=Streptomyces uncialis TaxID=1048205 RepID=A0A1Q4V5V1_9ACTN|nr:hypothetical protein AB852_17010 [Streptomyces uncialis]